MLEIDISHLKKKEINRKKMARKILPTVTFKFYIV